MATTSNTPRRASLGAIFLTVFIDLVGFSIIFPLFPAMLQWYLPLEGGSGPLSAFVALLGSLAPASHPGPDGLLTMVFFGGLLGSLYSLLQFVFSPIWGHMSDRMGRRRVLLITTAGTGLSYLLWAFSGQFWMLVLARLFGGMMAGNLSVATAAIADVTDKDNRSKGMALIGVAFGLGFITGPAIGGFSSMIDLTRHWPGLAAWGINPFSVPALAAALLAGINWLWIHRHVAETLPEDRREKHSTSINPFARLRVQGGTGGPVGRVLVVYFIFLLIFSGMEFTLTFLALERLDYGPRENTAMFVYIGVVLILVQGWFVRRYAHVFGERFLARSGVALALLGMGTLAYAVGQPLFYVGLSLKAVGVALLSPTLTALVSLYTPDTRQGAVLGIFRALGSLARATGPFTAAVLYWGIGSRPAYLLGAALLLIPLGLSLGLPQVNKDK